MNMDVSGGAVFALNQESIEDKKKKSGGTVCCVPGCNNNSKRDRHVSWNTFPKDEQLKLQWISLIERLGKNGRWNPTPHHRICGAHFNASGKKTAKDKLPLIFTTPGRQNPNTSAKQIFKQIRQTDDNTLITEVPLNTELDRYKEGSGPLNVWCPCPTQKPDCTDSKHEKCNCQCKMEVADTRQLQPRIKRTNWRRQQKKNVPTYLRQQGVGFFDCGMCRRGPRLDEKNSQTSDRNPEQIFPESAEPLCYTNLDRDPLQSPCLNEKNWSDEKVKIRPSGGTVCCFPGCRNNSKRDRHVSFNSFPKNYELRCKWVWLMQTFGKDPRWEPTSHHRVCGAHFNMTGKKTTEDKFPILYSMHDVAKPVALTTNKRTRKTPRLVVDDPTLVPNVTTA